MGHWRSGPPPGEQPQEVKSQWFSIRDDPISIIKEASRMWLIHLRGLKEAQLLYFLSTQDYHDLDDWNLHEFTCFSCACVGFLWALGKLLLLNWPQLLVCGCYLFVVALATCPHCILLLAQCQQREASSPPQLPLDKQSRKCMDEWEVQLLWHV